MKNNTIFLLLILITTLDTISSQIQWVPIKSHKMITKTITYKEINSIYDNNPNSIGSFYSSSEHNVEVEFDLEKNYLIDHVLITMKREKVIQNISILVGNSLNDRGSLLYVCEPFNELQELYKCQPVCKSSKTIRPGIIARKFIMILKVSSSWISIYEMRVFSKHVSTSDDISSHRLVHPLDCQAKSWLLTDSFTNISIPTNTNTVVFFEKPYTITELIIQFKNSSQENFEMSMIGIQNKVKTINVSLSDCSPLKSAFTCLITEKAFPAIYLNLTTFGVKKLFVKGKPAFYPKLQISTTFNKDEKLRMTCEYKQCDSSVHSACSEETMKSGVIFPCINGQLIRVPSGTESDTYIIVNRGSVEPTWSSTNFSVDHNSADKMVVSMPRNYRYFGQYKCACIVADELNTRVVSANTELSELDFLEDLIFEKKILYKTSDSEDAPFINVVNNVMFLHKSKLSLNYLPLKILLYSLINGNSVKVTFPVSAFNSEEIHTDRSIMNSVKAFENIVQSWSVKTYTYVLDELFPEFIHNGTISIFCTSIRSNLRHNALIKMLDEEEVLKKPVLWFNYDDNKVMETNIMYGNTQEAKLYYKEMSCLSPVTNVLATFTNEKCHSTDFRLICSQFQGATHLLFKQERNFAKNMILDLVDTSTNASIYKLTPKTNITLNQDDVVIKHRYIKLAPSLSIPNITTVTIELTITSKKVDDFFPCAKVQAQISIPNQIKRFMILQYSVFQSSVEMTSAYVSVNVTISIDGIPGSHVRNLLITNPTTFQVTNVEFQETKSLHLIWNGVNEIAKNILKYYQLTIDKTTVACNTTSRNMQNISEISLTSDATKSYRAQLLTTYPKYITQMALTIQPVFYGDFRGQTVKVGKQYGTAGQTTVDIDLMTHRTHRTFIVFPSQLEILCDVKDVIFEVIGLNVASLKWTPIPIGNMRYNISNLVPGRKYQLTAKVVYKYGPEDVASRAYTFETSDDVSIMTQRHVAAVNDLVNISCIGETGPNDQFIKTIQWLRSDKSSLPDGVKSIQSIFNPKIVFLIMEKASADFSGEYGCFALPSSSVGWMSMSIVVNDLDVIPTSMKVNFYEKIHKDVSVTCSSTAAANNNLIWIDPLGNVIRQSGSANKYSIKTIITEQKVHKSILTIIDVSVNTSGTYKCRKDVGNTGAEMKFFLFGEEELSIKRLTNSSDFIGEKQRYRCIAKPGLYSQTVRWQIHGLENDNMQLMNTSFPDPSDRTIQDIEFVNSLSIQKITCILSPILSTELTQSHSITLKSKIVVQGPTSVDPRTNVTLICFGYRNASDMQLEWVFYPNNKTAADKRVVVNDIQTMSKPYEPLKLNLNIISVENSEAGTYKCTFKARPTLQSRSIVLVVNSVQFPFDLPNSSAHVLFEIRLPIILFLTIITSLIIHN